MSLFSYIVSGGQDAMEHPTLASSGLHARLAFVLMLEDQGQRDRNRAAESLVYSLTTTIASAIDATIDRVEDMSTPARVSPSMQTFLAHRMPADDDGFESLHLPSQVTMTHQGKQACIILCEPWYNVGGPWPYHDSYTYAAYLANETARQNVLKAVRGLCQNLQMPLPELILMDERVI